ncbi:unnamed protein product [Effrenium voratum]|nr:unnamed protein product [Effrenium voratum]
MRRSFSILRVAPRKLQRRGLLVVSGVDVKSLHFNSRGHPELSPQDATNDALDEFNHPRLRRALILSSLAAEAEASGLCFESPARGRTHSTGAGERAAAPGCRAAAQPARAGRGRGLPQLSQTTPRPVRRSPGWPGSRCWRLRGACELRARAPRKPPATPLNT